MNVERQRNIEHEPQGLSLRRLTPQDYHSFNELAQSAWPGIKLFSEPIFVALTDNGVSVAATEGSELVGASFNFIKPAARSGEYALYVHMLGTRQERQGKGVGRKIMRENYRLIESGELGPGLTEVKLTSDPLEAKNVMFYLHHLGMIVQTYKPDAYKTLSTTGAEQHKGLPADRFVYTAQPITPWVRERRLPTPDVYANYVNQNPTAVRTFAENKERSAAGETSSPVVLVEVPMQIEAIKHASMAEAQDWRRYHQTVFASLFIESAGFSAVDAVTLLSEGIPRQFIVCMRNFDQENPECLLQQIENY